MTTKNTATQKAANVAKTTNDTIVDVEVKIAAPIAPLTQESLIAALPEGLNPDAGKIATTITRINAELVQLGATFDSNGGIIGISKEVFGKTCNRAILESFDEEIRELAREEASKAVMSEHAEEVKGIPKEALDVIIDETVNMMMDANDDSVGDVAEEYITNRLAELREKYPLPEPVVVVEASPTISSSVAEVSVTVKPATSTEQFEQGFVDSNSQRLEIKATDVHGKEVKVQSVQFKRVHVPYTPSFEQKQDSVDESWAALASPIPHVAELSDAELKEVVAKTIVAFRDKFNGMQCHWNTKLVFPDERVNLIGMFTKDELSMLVWGYAEPDLDCWDIQRVVPHVYGLEFFYDEHSAA